MAIYTDKEFYNDVLNLIAESDLDEVVAGAMTAKALKKLEQVEHRAEYSATHRKPATSKVSAATKEGAAEIGAILTAEPMTAAEINEVLGTDYTALRVANLSKYIPGVVTSKVRRMTTDRKGLAVEREYTAYSVE